MDDTFRRVYDFGEMRQRVKHGILDMLRNGGVDTTG